MNRDQEPAEVEEYSLKLLYKYLAYSAATFIGIFGFGLIACMLDNQFLIQVSVALSFASLLGCGYFLFCARDEWKFSDEMAEKRSKYLKELKAYNAREDERNTNRKWLNNQQKRLRLATNRIKEVRALRNEMYNANIIPKQYRNVYAVHYLYEYVESSQETDLDKIIQTFVLEEIKVRLDRIIEQQTEMILMERCMLAKQDRTNELIAKNHEEQMRQLASLEENMAHQDQYLEMINTNLVISNYFAYNDYINK